MDIYQFIDSQDIRNYLLEISMNLLFLRLRF